MSFPGLGVDQLPFNYCKDNLFLTTTKWGLAQWIMWISLANGNLTLLNADIGRRRSGSSETGSANQSLLCVTANGSAVIMESACSHPAIVGYIFRNALARYKMYIKVDATLV
jgi:hypothetical protein